MSKDHAKSRDGKILYAIIYNPFATRVVMNMDANCTGCTGFRTPWDTQRIGYYPYCNTFSVWNEYDEYGHAMIPHPNGICIDNLRFHEIGGH